MKRKNINRLNAAISTTTFCDASAAETAAITAFAILVLLIKGKIVIVQSFNELGDTSTKGVTLDTKALRKAMMEATYRLGNAIFSYAAGLTPPSENLMAQSKLVIGTLERLSKEECATECDRIQKLAATLGVLITPYGALPADITDTGSLVTLYMTSYGDPRAAVVTRKNAKIQADLVLNDIMDNLLTKQLDPMANTLRFTNNSWWMQYHLSREVIDLGTTFTKLKATVVDQSDNPVKGVLISLLQGGVLIRSKKTDAEGKVSISKIKPGDYDIKAEKTDYLPQLETGVHFSPGSEVPRTITVFFLGISAVREGNVPGPGIGAIPTEGIAATPISTITFEVTGILRFYFSPTPGAAPGATFWDAPIGTTTMPVDEFKVLGGFDGDTGVVFLNAQNNGVASAHYKITITHLEVNP